MVKPQPYKLICLKCNYLKVVKPKSDALNPMDMMSKCPKCAAMMEKKELSIFDEIKSAFK